MKLLPTLALAGCLLAACATPPRGERPVDDPTTPAPEPQPYRLEDEGEAPPRDVEFEEDILDPPEQVEADPFDPAPVESEPVPDPERVPPSVQVPVAPRGEDALAPQPPASGQRGFRVQIAALGSVAEAETVAREARSRTGVSAHVVLEEGLYKVHVGDFTDRAEALTMRDRCRSLGYSGSWVVTTRILVDRD